MSKLGRGLVAAMEDDEVVQQVQEVMVPETEKEVEVASNDVETQEAEIAEVVTAVEDAEVDAETLGEIQTVMAETVETGEGTDSNAGEIAAIAVEAICARLGIKSKQKVIPGTEAFGEKKTKLAATKVAVEAIGETISKIWKAIMAALKQVWEKVKSFVVGLLKNRTLLLKHLESLKAKIASIDAAAEKAEEELKGSVAKAFSIGGKASFATAEKIMSDSEKLIKATNVGANHSVSIASKMIDIKGDPANLDSAAVDLLDNIRGAFEPLGKVDSKSAGKDGATVAHYGNLAFGKSVGITYSEGEKTTVNLVVEENTDLAEAAEALSKEQMTKLLDQAIALVKNLQDVEKSQKDLTAIAKACDNVTSAVLKGAANNQAGDGKDEADKKESEAIHKAAGNIRALSSMIAKFGASLPSSVFSAAKSAGDYVSASANNFKVKKEEKAAA